MAELHIGSAMKQVMGTTKDPGVSLFRSLRDQWRDLEIDYNELDVPDFSQAPQRLKDLAEETLSWATKHLAKKTFPRDDYKEFMELVIISLGGKVEGFVFKLPGPYHHARWMSKVIYNLKMKLVSKFFEMSEDEKEKVNQVVEFILLFYTKYWFTTPLAGSAARQDLDFMSSILEYRNLVVVNDLAERGIHLATDFIKRVDSEEQRGALSQVVDFSGRVKDTSKASLKLC